MDSFYFILHANVCASKTSGLKTTSQTIEFMACPIPFKEEINLKAISFINMNEKLFLYGWNRAQRTGFWNVLI
tara:strand:- start:601 stop:819 length:219 start_codon:yes stop_codon:yes gene_type:complete